MDHKFSEKSKDLSNDAYCPPYEVLKRNKETYRGKYRSSGYRNPSLVLKTDPVKIAPPKKSRIPDESKLFQKIKLDFKRSINKKQSLA